MFLSPLSWLFALIGISLLSLLFSLRMGSVDISFYDYLHSLWQGRCDPTIQMIIGELRLPRALSAFVTGALLALSGSMMQVLLRNPLADPYVLGTSGGAALAVLLCMLLGLGQALFPFYAWGGSGLAMLLIFVLCHHKKQWNSEYLLLNGITLASSFSALISFILFISPTATLHGMLFWLLGDLSQAPMPYLESIILLLGGMYAFYLAPQLNILMRGENSAQSLGISMTRLQIQIYFLCTLFTATSVALAGCIGFIGLLVPHIFRLLGGQDYRYLLPGAALLGGSLLVLADTFSRILLSPLQLPVGLMTALLGLPVFIFLLQKRGLWTTY